MREHLGDGNARPTEAELQHQGAEVGRRRRLCTAVWPSGCASERNALLFWCVTRHLADYEAQGYHSRS